MLGFVIGTVSLLGLFKMARHGGRGCHGEGRGGWRGRHGWHGGHGGHGWHRGHGGPGGWRGRGRGGPWAGGEDEEDGRGPRGGVEAGIKWMLIRKLGLREEQEVTVDAVAAEVKKALQRYRDDLAATRTDLASAVRGETVDHVRLDVLFESQDESMRELRKDLVRAVERLHASLDEAQRVRLSDLLSTDFFGWADGGAR